MKYNPPGRDKHARATIALLQYVSPAWITPASDNAPENPLAWALLYGESEVKARTVTDALITLSGTIFQAV